MSCATWPTPARHRFLKRLNGHPLELIEAELGGHNLAAIAVWLMPITQTYFSN
jgi:hypothetical protein